VNIEIRDAALDARVQEQHQATGSASVEEVLLRLLETQEEQDRWLLENREAINAKIRRGIGLLLPSDAAYIALAEKLGATLITRDVCLAAAFARGVTIELF
jgi:predicted nucleic acid-binding protein